MIGPELVRRAQELTKARREKVAAAHAALEATAKPA